MDSLRRRVLAYDGIWRKPAAETIGPYPGLVVMDNRVSGSITTGQSRLPLWCFVYTALTEGWASVEHNWSPSKYGWDAARFGTFLSDLLEQRGEFARLLCLLADVERRDRGMDDAAWWERKTQRNRVLAQLRRCVAAMEAQE